MMCIILVCEELLGRYRNLSNSLRTVYVLFIRLSIGIYNIDKLFGELQEALEFDKHNNDLTDAVEYMLSSI